MKLNGKHWAFTLAEVLLVLSIIGIISALTIPAVIKNTQNKELESAFKKSYSNLIAAYNKASINNPQTDYTGTVNYYSELAEAIYAEFSIAKRISASEANKYEEKIKTYTLKNGLIPQCSQLFLHNGKAIKTASGSAISIIYNCSSNWITIDTNGIDKKPNAYGHDVFLFMISNSGKLAPASTEAEWKCDEEGNCGYDTSPEVADKCTKNSASAINGITCAKYAIIDKCPDDSSKSYWECLP